MSAIIYEGDLDIQLDTIRLNGKYDAIEVFQHEEAHEEDDELITFQSATALTQFIDALLEAAKSAGYYTNEGSN